MTTSESSKTHIIFLGHTPFSYQIHQIGMGEVNNVHKFKTILRNSGYSTSDVIDIYQLFGGKSAKKKIAQMAAMNFRLGALNYEPIDSLNTYSAKKAVKTMKGLIQQAPSKACMMALTFDKNIAALVASGIGHAAPFVVKTYVPFTNIGICSKIYQWADLVVTECLFANLLGVFCGIPPWKMVYLPHNYPTDANALYALPDEEAAKMKDVYLKRLSMACNKSPILTPHTVVIGIVSRFTEGKHIEHAIESVERCIAQGMDVILVLKGGYDEIIIGSRSFKNKLTKTLQRVACQSWFLWDKEHTPFPEVLKIFSSFDICMHLSAMEGGSNLVVEMMALGKPCLLLDENTNPFLFKGGAELVEPSALPWYGKKQYKYPDPTDLYKKLSRLILDKEERQRLGRRAREIAIQRFAPQRSVERMPLLLEAAERSHLGEDMSRSASSQKILNLLKADLELYQIPTNISVEEIGKRQFPQVIADTNYQFPSIPLINWDHFSEC